MKKPAQRSPRPNHLRAGAAAATPPQVKPVVFAILPANAEAIRAANQTLLDAKVELADRVLAALAGAAEIRPMQEAFLAEVKKGACAVGVGLDDPKRQWHVDLVAMTVSER